MGEVNRNRFIHHHDNRLAVRPASPERGKTVPRGHVTAAELNAQRRPLVLRASSCGSLGRFRPTSEYNVRICRDAGA